MGRIRAWIKRRRRIVITLEILAVLVISGVAVLWFLRPDDDDRRREKATAAAAAFNAGEHEKSALLFRSLLKEDPGHLGYRQNLAVCLIRMNRLDEAKATVREVLKIEPAYAPAHKLLSDLAWARGDVATALRETRLAAEGKKVAKQARLTLADRLIAAGQTTEGIEILQGEVEADRDSDAAVGRLIPWVVGGGEKSAVIVRAERKLHQAFEDARKEYLAAPESSEALKKFVRLGLMSGSVLPAMEALEEAGKQRDLDVDERLLLVRALAAAGEIPKAREYMDTFDDGTVEDRVDAWLAADAPGKALSTFDSLPDTTDRTLGLLRLELRILLSYARTPGGAAADAEVSRRIVETATAILGVYPGDEVALSARAPAQLSRGMVREALRDALALREVAPNNPAGEWLQGLALMASGRAASAHLLLEGRREETQPGEARWLAEASIRVGNGAAALRELEGYTGVAATALRVAALALAGDADAASGLAETSEFQSDPLRERLLAAKILALRAKPDVARALIGELGALDASMGPLLEIGDIHLVLGDTAAARKAYEAAVESDGPAALAALGRLADVVLSQKPMDEEALEGILDRMRKLEDGGLAALLIEGRACVVRGEPEKAVKLAGEALTAEPGAPDARILMLTALLAMGGEGDRISDAAESVLEILPGHGPARVVRARRLVEEAKAKLASGGIAGASENLDEAVDLIPGASEALFLRGIVSASSGEVEAAEEDAKLLMESPGGAASGNYLAGVLRMQQGRVADAVTSFRISLEAEPESAVAAAGLAGALLTKGEMQGAMDLADEWLGRDPQIVWAVRAKAFALAGLGRAAEGAEILRARAGGDVTLLSLRMMAGWLLFQAGKPGEAASEFGAVVEGQPLNARARALHLEACLAAKDRDGAGKIVERAIARKDIGAVGLLLRARLRSAEGNEDGARNDLRQAVIVAPDDPVARFLLGESLAATGDIPGAREHMERAAALLPGAVQPRLTLALIASEQKRDLDAARLYEEVLALQPGNALAANNLAHHLTGSPSAQPERPVELARMAVSAVPKFAPFHDTLAMALAAAGEFDEACEVADRALGLEKTNVNIFINAVRIHRDAGNIERAKEIAKLAEASVTDEEKFELTRRIDELKLYLPEEEDEEEDEEK